MTLAGPMAWVKHEVMALRMCSLLKAGDRASLSRKPCGKSAQNGKEPVVVDVYVIAACRSLSDPLGEVHGFLTETLAQLRRGGDRCRRHRSASAFAAGAT